MTKDSFLILLLNAKDSLDCSCQKSKYQAWTSIKNINDLLENIGVLESSFVIKTQNLNKKNHSNKLSYWSTEAKIVLDFYPYIGSDIYSCKLCHAIFFFYIEYAGHYPENRLRWAQAQLIE